MKERRIQVGYVYGGRKYPVFAWAREDGICGYEIGRGGDMGCGGAFGDMDTAKEMAGRAMTRLQDELNRRWAYMVEQAEKVGRGCGR